MSSRLRLVVLSVSTPILAFALVGGFFSRIASGQDTYTHLRIFEDVVSLISTNYVEEVELDRVMAGAMRGLADGLDPDSSHLTPDEVRGLEASNPSPTGEVGISLTRQYYLRVVAARDGSPAAEAGLMTGDFIRGIDGIPTRDMSLFAGQRMLQGPVGSTVELTVIRGSAAEPHVIELVRVAPPANVPSVPSARLLQPTLGYIRILAFDDQVAQELRDRVDEMQRAGATRLIIDIRRNAEGPLSAGVAAARLFVADGTLASREARGKVLERLEARSDDGAIDLPLVLLANRGTSGAAEVFAAALAGNDRAELVGERTLGRTAEQKLVKLPDGSGLWMSWARYEGPGDLTIHGTGVSPSIAVDEPSVEFGETPDGDPVLDAAIESLSARETA